MANPFSIVFGKKPRQYIPRVAQTNHVIDDFTSENPSTQVYMITGVRGSGKTVMMTNIDSFFANMDDWIVIELNPERDMLQALAAKLYDIPQMHRLFLAAKLNLSAFGIGASIEGSAPVSDIDTAVERMLTEIKKKGKKVLISIDEATNNQNVRVFAASFQIYIRKELPVFLLMTGLYDNINNLQNEKSLTFLYRAPKLQLEPLNITAVIKSYMDVFHISYDEAKQMAVITQGYSFAFQVLGYLRWENINSTLEQILPEYDQYLEEYVYGKIWSELSELDRQIVHELAMRGESAVKDIRGAIEMKSEQFSLYRDRLIKKGVVASTKYGYLSLVLPRFDLFVNGLYDIGF